MINSVLIINGDTLVCTDPNGKYCKILIEPKYLTDCMKDAIIALLEKNSFTKPVSDQAIISLALKYYTKVDIFTPSTSCDKQPLMDKLLCMLKNLQEYTQMLKIAKWILYLNNDKLSINLDIGECDSDCSSFEILIEEERLKSCMKDAIYTLVEKGRSTSPNSVIKLALLYYANSSSIYIYTGENLLNKFISILKELPEFKIVSSRFKSTTIQIQKGELVKRTIYPSYFNIQEEDVKILIDPIEIKLCMLDAMLSFIENGNLKKAMNSGSVICLALGYYTGIYSYNIKTISASKLWKKLTDIYFGLEPRKKFQNNPNTNTILNKIFQDYTNIKDSDFNTNY